MRNNLKISAITLLLVLFTFSLWAQQDGALDNTFGINGILTFTVGSTDNLKSIVLQPDGKILLGGISQSGVDRFFISRLLPSDGSIDPGFNGGAHKVFSDSSSLYGLTVALKADGSILYGGGRGDYKWGRVGQLTSSGADVYGPVGYAVGPPTYQHNITSMSYNAITDKIALGGFISYTNSYSLAYKFNSDGTANTAFNGGKRYMDNTFASPTFLTSAKAVVSMDDGSVLIVGSTYNFSSTDSMSIAKLRPDGSFDNSFGTPTANGIARIRLGSYSSGSGLLVLPDGKIMVCGTTSNNFAIARLNANGTLDNSFNAVPFTFAAGYNNVYNSMFLQPDGKIIASGTSSSSAKIGAISRYNTDGSLDPTFGTNGTVFLNNMEINASAISTSDKKAYFAGRNSTNRMTIVRIKYEIQKYNILGKDIVSLESENDFLIHPTEVGYSYNWSYTTSNVYPLGTLTNDTLTLYFGKTATSGTLYCSITDQGGSVVKIAKKDVVVNPDPTPAEFLADIQCAAAQTYADNNYINSFKLLQTKVLSTNTGASLTGYSDLTASSNYDTLYTGDNYQASLECIAPISGILYCGIWIDLNNDGKIEEVKEFVGSAASDTRIFNVNNIVIPTESEPGPKRLRVRIRQGAPFNSNEACMPNEEFSETEDYLIVVSTYDGIQAPNFITPNNDGKNDNFIVRGVKSGQNNSLKVFNRIGDLVYDKENYDNSWGGSDKSGGQLRPGTYYFVFTQPNVDKGKDDVVKGFFEIRY